MNYPNIWHPKGLLEYLRSQHRHAPDGRTRQAMLDLDRILTEHRPVRSDGKHGDLHTSACGCEDKNAPKSCDTFHWVGQSFAHCDNCGRPYWDHTYEIIAGTGTLFGHDAAKRPITSDQKASCRAKWGRDVVNCGRGIGSGLIGCGRCRAEAENTDV